MQVEALAVALRPRSMAEAADLGAALVHQHARSVWRSFTPVLLIALAVALTCASFKPWMPALVLFWLKPWLDRSLLFILSRAVFGQATTFGDIWRQRRQVWWAQLPVTLTLRRLSPWRSFTQPIHQLEGLRGKPLRQRRAQLLRGKRSSAGWMHAAFANIEMALNGGVAAALLWFTPDGLRAELFNWYSADSMGASLLLTSVFAATMLALEPFYVAAGFAMYLNRRVELEAWDVEQEFRHAFGR